MLGGYDDRVYPDRLSVVVFDRDLGRPVRPQIRKDPVLSDLGQSFGQSVGHGDRQRHQFRGLVAREAKHQSLVSRTCVKAIAEAFGVDTAGMEPADYRKAAIDAVRKLSVDVGIPTKLEKLKEEDLPFLCESAAADACAPGNPRAASLADFEAMFRKLM